MHTSAIASADLSSQIAYLADDKELAAVMWQIAGLPEEARLIVRMMVAQLSDRQGAGQPALRAR